MKIDWILIRGIIHYMLQPILNTRRIPLRWSSLGISTGSSASINSDNRGHGSPAASASGKTSGPGVTFKCTRGTLSVSAVTPHIWRVLVRHDRDPEYRTWSIACSPDGGGLSSEFLTDGTCSISNSDDNAKGGIRAVLNTATSTLEFRYGGRVLHSDSRSPGFNRGWISCRKRSPEPELYLGFGEKTGPLFKNGMRLVMWNTDDRAMNPQSDPIYQSCPLQIAVRRDGSAHALFYDNSHYAVLKPGNRGSFPESFYAAERGPLCYYVMAGPTLRDVVRQFTHLTGRYPLPPRWTLGHHHSRWEEEESADRIIGIAEEFRKRDIPCDALYLDIGHMRGYRCFTWNRDCFPDPKALMESLHAKHFKAVVITDPGIKRDQAWDIYQDGIRNGYFCTDSRGKVFHAPVWAGPSAFPDFSSQAVCDWWGGLFSGYTEVGLDGYWNDMNEPSLYTPLCTMPNSVRHRDGARSVLNHRTLHNVYGMLMAKASFEGISRLSGGRRPFLITRASFAGIQRYASSWTGDNRSNWKHYRLSVSMLLNMSLCGQVMVGADIGGFWWHPTPELMVRWMQLGSFYPFSRNHTRQNTPHQEIWHFGQAAESICREFLCLRYSLLPYSYSCLRESCESGLPLMRPIFMEFPDDPQCLDRSFAETEFMSGPNLLIAPVLGRRALKREIYLPGSCCWYDWWSGHKIEGGKVHLVETPLSRMPIYVRGGSIIPISGPVQVSDETERSSLTLLVFPDEASGCAEGTLYLDDGISLEYTAGFFSLINIRAEAVHGRGRSERIELTIERAGGRLESLFGNHPRVFVKVRAGDAADLRINGARPIDLRTDGEWLEAEIAGSA